MMLLCALVSTAAASQTAEPRIYTCVDGKGRRLTADRPIVECLDREQKELNPSGTVRRLVGPSLTPQERAAEEEKARRAAEEKARAADEKRRERALLDRYPDAASHARARASELQLIESTLGTSHAEFAAERARINARFDAELARLRPLWDLQRAAGAAK
jgi:hypothetical protein